MADLSFWSISKSVILEITIITACFPLTRLNSTEFVTLGFAPLAPVLLCLYLLYHLLYQIYKLLRALFFPTHTM